jgi:hypothetical protein
MARTVAQLVVLTMIMAIAAGGSQRDIELNGKKLFERETFGGNGRTCLTCHSKLTGTLTLDDISSTRPIPRIPC